MTRNRLVATMNSLESSPNCTSCEGGPKTSYGTKKGITNPERVGGRGSQPDGGKVNKQQQRTNVDKRKVLVRKDPVKKKDEV